MVLVTSFAMLGLLGTGLTIWVRRTFRKRESRASPLLLPPSRLKPSPAFSRR